MSTCLTQGYNGQKNFTIPSLFDRVGPEALKDCLQLERLVIPGTVKKIEHCAFENCVNLQEVVLEEGIEELGNTGNTICHLDYCSNVRCIQLLLVILDLLFYN